MERLDRDQEVDDSLVCLPRGGILLLLSEIACKVNEHDGTYNSTRCDFKEYVVASYERRPYPICRAHFGRVVDQDRDGADERNHVQGKSKTREDNGSSRVNGRQANQGENDNVECRTERY